MIPKYAHLIGEKYIEEKNCNLYVYTWFASKGYKTNYKQIQNWGVRIVSLKTNDKILEKTTCSENKLKQWSKHWKDNFNLNIKY